MTRRLRPSFAGGVVAAVVVVVVGVAVFRLTQVARDLRHAEKLIDEAAAALTEGALADAEGSLELAQRHVLRANESLRGSAALDLIGWIPGLQQNLSSLEDSVTVAATVIHGGARILEAAGPLESSEGTLEVSLSDGSIPLAAVEEVQEEIEVLSSELRRIGGARERSFLVPAVQELQSAVDDEVVERTRQLGMLGHGLRLLQHVAGGEGSRRYLVAVANTAEMRGSGGMVLNYGVLEGRDGTIDLTAFGRIDELALAEPVSSDVVPADYLARWDGFDPLLRWRQANLAGDFTLIAPALEAMFTAATRQPVNGVIQIDPAGLAAILDGVGPVRIPELGEVRGDNVIALTLNEAYIRFPDVEQRSDVLGDVAEAAFRKLVDGEVPSLRTLATRLAEAVDGRHLVVHSTTPRIQDDLVSLGADGAYAALDGPDVFALTAQNLSGNKLDYYLDTSLQLTGVRPAADLGSIDATVTLENTAPVGVTEPRYIFGPLTQAHPPAGVLRSLVTLYLPLGASLEAADGDTTVEAVTSGAEGGRPYISYTADVAAGGVHSLRLSIRLAPRPEGPYELRLEPSPRLRPTSVAVDIDVGRTTTEGEIVLDRGWVLREGRKPTPVQAPVER